MFDSGLPCRRRRVWVQVYVCDPTWTTDILKAYCWADAASARASCAPGADCTVAYKRAVTPSLDLYGVAPRSGAAGTRLQFSGTLLDNVTTVQLVDGSGAVAGTCAATSAGPTYGICSAPDLRAGTYGVRLSKANGEWVGML